MNELERTEMEARTKRWGEMVYGPFKANIKAAQDYVVETATRWKQIADRKTKSPYS